LHHDLYELPRLKTYACGSVVLVGDAGTAAIGLPLPIRAESSCRRQPRVNTVPVCADEPPARHPAGYRDSAVRRQPGPAGRPAGRDLRGAASAAATGDQGPWPAGWPAPVAGQRVWSVSEQRALSWPALWADQNPTVSRCAGSRPGRQCCRAPMSCASTR